MLGCTLTFPSLAQIHVLVKVKLKNTCRCWTQNMCLNKTHCLKEYSDSKSSYVHTRVFLQMQTNMVERGKLFFKDRGDYSQDHRQQNNIHFATCFSLGQIGLQCGFIQFLCRHSCVHFLCCRLSFFSWKKPPRTHTYFVKNHFSLWSWHFQRRYT